MRIQILAAMAVFGALAADAASAETQTYALSGFSKVKVSAGNNAEITVGPAYAVRAEGKPEALERLDIRVDGDTLIIGRKHRTGFNWGRSEGRLVVFVSTPKLDAVDASSGSSTRTTGVSAPAFSTQASSGSSLSIAGSCGSLNADASSGASLNAGDLQCKTVNADASSGASLTVFASETAQAEASSGASVSVKGSPKSVNQNTSSGGSVSVR